MEQIRAILTDDEEAARNVLFQLLNRECPIVEVIARCNDVSSTVLAIKEFKPDVVFLDIQMPHYAGYEIVDFFDVIDFEIIFVTAYDQYAIKAFELNAVDYLVKPISRQRLALAVEKLQNKINNRNTVKQYHLLKQALQNKKVEHIVIAELGKQNIIKLADIIGIEACGAYSFIHLAGNEKLTVTKNIRQFESLLPEDGTFFRAHKSWIIHKRHIKHYAKLKLEIELSEGITARLSRYKKEEFEELVK